MAKDYITGGMCTKQLDKAIDKWVRMIQQTRNFAHVGHIQIIIIINNNFKTIALKLYSIRNSFPFL